MADPIPLSLLALDHPEPPNGWAAFLAAQGMKTTLDDIGRWCISRAAARELLTQKFQNEARKARIQAEQDRRAEEADREFRANLNPGVAWYAIPPGVAPAQLLRHTVSGGGWRYAQSDFLPGRHFERPVCRGAFVHLRPPPMACGRSG